MGYVSLGRDVEPPHIDIVVYDETVLSGCEGLGAHRFFVRMCDGEKRGSHETRATIDNPVRLPSLRLSTLDITDPRK